MSVADSYDVVFRCSEKLFAYRDSIVKSALHVASGTYFHSSEFCVWTWTVSNTIGRSPLTAAPVPKERDAFVLLLLRCDMFDPLSSLLTVGNSSNDVTGAGETCSGISDSDSMS